MDRPLVSQIWLSSVWYLLLRWCFSECSFMHTHMQVLIHKCAEAEQALLVSCLVG
ncbi:hypothetical protein V8C42DRAFT_332128 [Trichoderma barbatum]